MASKNVVQTNLPRPITLSILLLKICDFLYEDYD